MFKHDGFFPIYIIDANKNEEMIKDIQVNTFNSKIRVNGIEEVVDYTPNNLTKLVDEYKKNESLFYDNKKELDKTKQIYRQMLETIDIYNNETNNRLQKGGAILKNLKYDKKILTYKNIPIKINKNNQDNYISEDGEYIKII